MTNYGKNDILGAATVLPATASTGLLLLATAHPVIVAGFFIVTAINLVVLIGSISRFVVNNFRQG